MSSDAPETDIDEQTQHEAEVAAVLDVDVAPEADLDGDEWGDLDAEDFDDPLMIFKYMKQTELITLPHPKYMALQKELAWSMHGILLDWLVFLSACVVSLTKLQLMGITSCLSIASKERYILKTIDWNLSYPNLMHFLRHTRKSDDHNGETLEWQLLATPPSLLLLR
ncbi:uncharacterized protein F5891DRAFT_983840 [Suillus fuscotomentosus]|uniref:Cyclin N-terminal domain-containing protein n=1 Tax=Suillus fuscotomentosus TaxID=1912939 RepID=A0AAD4HFR5_9AGAM|nr:uncharacterized protein F5891DRAFT_983840 [Suillus fuscotomentosus]KAG1895995.1 hypothetical protein F5891DRAFT_983840 [Suillus fuscotomentosus]